MRRRKRDGFTLAEMLVATILISIVMTGVYWLFHSTLRTWRQAESGGDGYLNARIAVGIMSHELDNVLRPAGYLFQGEDDEFTMVTVTEPMDVEDAEGRHLMWVRYRHNATRDTIERQEAEVELALPARQPPGVPIDPGKLQLSSKEEFTVAENVADFSVRYIWLPVARRRDRDKPPQWVKPIYFEQHEEGWGLPQGVEITMRLVDPAGFDEDLVVRHRQAFRGMRPEDYPTPEYLDQLLGDDL